MITHFSKASQFLYGNMSILGISVTNLMESNKLQLLLEDFLSFSSFLSSSLSLEQFLLPTVGVEVCCT